MELGCDDVYVVGSNGTRIVPCLFISLYDRLWSQLNF